MPLPPEPIITRFGTWIVAAIYYCDNFDAVRSVVDFFERDDAASIGNVQDLLSSPQIKAQLVYIKNNFKVIVHSITKLETKVLDEVVEITENFIENELT